MCYHKFLISKLYFPYFFQQPFYKQISAVFEWTLVVTLDLYFATFAVEFRRLKMTHTFEYYKEGSWAEFPTMIHRSGSTSRSEDTMSTRSSYLANTNYIINYDVKNLCQHNNGRTTSAAEKTCQYVRTQRLQSRENIWQHKNSLTHSVPNSKDTCHTSSTHILPTGEWCIDWATTV